MANWSLNQRSLGRLKYLHPDLVSVVHLAVKYSKQRFQVTQGIRTIAQQRDYLAAGKSRTLDSRHLTAHAIDFHALDDKGNALWEAVFYAEIARAVFKAAKELGIEIKWGGNWKSFKDYPHFHLARAFYSRTSNPNLPADILRQVLDALDIGDTELNSVLGSQGMEVRAIQIALNNKLDAGLKVDGDFGTVTLQAVKKFQHSISIEPTGIVDGVTLKALMKP